MQRIALSLFTSLILVCSGVNAQVPSDLLIVPGRSLAKISLGMSQNQISNLLGKPNRGSADCWEYLSTPQSLKIYFQDGTLSEIEFTSPKFKTQEGIGLSNCSEEQWHRLFINSKSLSPFTTIRYQLKSGGLTFFDVNADSQNSSQPHEQIGVIYATSEPRHLPESIGMNANWQPVDATSEAASKQ